MDLTDEALIKKFKTTKDLNQFKSLVRRYQNRLYNTAFRILGNMEEAEEVVQDTFLRVHQNLDGFRDDARFASWVFRITHNVCVDFVRMKQRQKNGVKVMSFDPQSCFAEDEHGAESAAVSLGQVADPHPDPAQKLALEEQERMIQQSLLELPDNQREVLVLHDIEGFSYQEIADIVGTSIGTVRSRLHYGRVKLRELLSSYLAGNEIPTASR
ncbi:MAG TPA: RNA polymerase sigma factor [Candidatus Obscuribacterales bacterium]